MGFLINSLSQVIAKMENRAITEKIAILNFIVVME